MEKEIDDLINDLESEDLSQNSPYKHKNTIGSSSFNKKAFELRTDNNSLGKKI